MIASDEHEEKVWKEMFELCVCSFCVSRDTNCVPDNVNYLKKQNRIKYDAKVHFTSRHCAFDYVINGLLLHSQTKLWSVVALQFPDPWQHFWVDFSSFVINIWTDQLAVSRMHSAHTLRSSLVLSFFLLNYYSRNELTFTTVFLLLLRFLLFLHWQQHRRWCCCSKWIVLVTFPLFLIIFHF